jgi:glycosyltransferase involved in cell wall biosynthesis
MLEFDFKKTPGKFRFNRDLIFNGKEPLVSIITPFFNAGQYFMETVNCVLNQTFPHFEWIIIDDGSTNEEDIKVLKQVDTLDSRIKIYQKDNGGPSAARNVAIKKSQTEIIIPLDADDLIEPTFVECIYWSLFTNPEASWSYTDSIGFFEQEYLWKKPFNIKQMKVENILTYAAGIRKKDLMEIGLQSEQEKYMFEDWHQWLKLLGIGKKGIHLGWYGFWYRRTDTGVLGQISGNKDIYKRTQKLIAEAAKCIKNDLKFIEYPRYTAEKSFSKPLKWEWKFKQVVDNDKTKVLLLLPHMVMGGADLFNLDIVSRIDKDKFEISVITTNPGDSSWRQRFEEHVIDLFDLTTFSKHLIVDHRQQLQRQQKVIFFAVLLLLLA